MSMIQLNRWHNRADNADGPLVFVNPAHVVRVEKTYEGTMVELVTGTGVRVQQDADIVLQSMYYAERAAAAELRGVAA